MIARNTAFTYKGKPVDAKAIGKDLGVRYVLEGSVQPSGDQVRVNAQLIDADSGAHLWAEQFDTRPRRSCCRRRTRSSSIWRARWTFNFTAGRGRSSQTDARGKSRRRGFGSPVRVRRCRKPDSSAKEADAGYPLCEQALAIDPNNVRALTVLAIKFYMPVNLGTSADPKADLKRADELRHRPSLPTSAGAHIVKTWI